MAKNNKRKPTAGGRPAVVNPDISAAELAALYKKLKSEDDERRAQMAAQEEEYRAMQAELLARRQQLQSLEELLTTVLTETRWGVEQAITAAQGSITAQEEKMSRYLSKRDWLAARVQPELGDEIDDADDEDVVERYDEGSDRGELPDDENGPTAETSRGQTHVVFTALGGTQETGGNCYLLEFRRTGRKIMIDAGIRFLQGADRLPALGQVKEQPDLLIVTHAHLDHCGALPVVAKRWPAMPIWCSHEALPLIKLALQETAKVMGSESVMDETELPLYSLAEVNEVKLTGVSFAEAVYPFGPEELEITLHRAGHQFGAASVAIRSAQDSVFVSGDFAWHDEPTVARADWPQEEVDLLVLESTFGNRPTANREAAVQNLLKKVADAVQQGGYVLIAASAVGPAQDIYLWLRAAMLTQRTIPDFQIYLDGKVRSACQLYSRRRRVLPGAQGLKGSRDLFFSYPGIAVTDELRPRVWDKPCCIISSSASLVGGPSVYYAQQLVRRDDSLIILTTPQEASEDIEERLDAWAGGKPACQVMHFAWAAHPSQEELLAAVDHLSPQGVLLVHGQPEATRALARALPADIRARVPQNGDRIVIRPRS